MKILQIGKFYPIKGGVEKVMYGLTLGLSGRNIRCDMLCAGIDRQESGMLLINNYARLWCMPTWLKLAATAISPAMIIKLRKIQREYDIIHVHHPDPMACLTLFLSGYKGKVVLHWHSDILRQKALLKLYRPLQRWMIGRADVIVGTTPVYVQQSPFLQQVQDKTTYILIGIDEVKVEEDAVIRIKEQYAGKKMIFSMGRLVEYKGYEYLIKAARYLHEDYVICIGGSGPLKDDLKQIIDSQGLNKRVKLIGFIPENEVAAHFMACDVFVLSSIWKTEAFGIVQIEAMSCGKPVVATCIEGSGVSWVNKDGVSGYNVEPQNAEALAEAIRKLLSDSQLYAKFSAGARQRYETLFTQQKMIDNCLKLYNDLLENGKA
ncbi:MAG: glycosyltransferase [Dysgonamonadaceae bacterium]|jgi:rhamnosyl/mannosyltransferase|nr:glycosyltransferase [Dysgonamonadaceae bacterium]